jgi:two-component system sensor kinase FixL
MVAATCLTVAGLHAVIWCWDRRVWANFWFAIMALSVIGLVIGEVATMFAASPSEYADAFRWSHMVYGIVVLASLSFVHVYFGTGRRWLYLFAIGMRLITVIINFSTGLSLHIGSIESLAHVPFLGSQVAVLGEWEPNPWVVVGQFSTLIQVCYVMDASIRLWNTGSHEARRRSAIFGGTLIFFTLYSAAYPGLATIGLIRAPVIVSMPFLAVLLAMAYELSSQLHRAAKIGAELHESEQRLHMATEAANAGIWIREIKQDTIWASDRWRELFGFDKNEPIHLGAAQQRLHPDDRQMYNHAFSTAINNAEDFELEYRIILPNGKVRWIVSRGKVVLGTNGSTAQVRGVSVDISERKRLEIERQDLKDELAHAGRVNVLGQFASSLAHELGQPLGAILRNAEAADMLLQQPSPDLMELREIISDICRDDYRACEVINRLRSLLTRRTLEMSTIEIAPLLNEVASLVKYDVIARLILLQINVTPSLPPALGDRVQLQQVLLNLIMNAIDAIGSKTNSSDKSITIQASLNGANMIEVSVRDTGPGVSPSSRNQIFEPFVTSKADGMGMGLAVSRAIIEFHGGKIWLNECTEDGATFMFTLCPIETA